MFRYLKAAFFFSPPLPGVGRIPWNILGLACLGILGLANPGFWLLGAGLEAAYLFSLATNRRFQRLIETQDAQSLELTTEQQTQKLTTRLGAAARARFNELVQKRARILELFQDNQAPSLTLRANQQALTQLSWVYLKLLIAQQSLQSPENKANEELLLRQAAALQRELGNELPPALRESKQATLDILSKRLQILSHREKSLAEIDSDLTRVEAQMNLLLENSTLRGRPEAMNLDIELASSQFDGEIYGDDQEVVSKIDRQYERKKVELAPDQRSI